MNNETGEMFKLKKQSLSANIFKYFNSVSEFDISEYKHTFSVDLNDDKSFSLRHTRFGSKVIISEQNYIFSIGGVDKESLLRFAKGESSEDALSTTNIVFTPDSLFFLRANNRPRLFPGLFISSHKLFVCGGVSAFERHSKPLFLTNFRSF